MKEDRAETGGKEEGRDMVGFTNSITGGERDNRMSYGSWVMGRLDVLGEQVCHARGVKIVRQKRENASWYHEG